MNEMNERQEPINPQVDTLALKLKLRELKRQRQAYTNLHPNDASLLAVLDLCCNTQAKVHAELLKIEKALKKLEPRLEDPKVKTQYNYLQYHGWFTVEHTRRAASESQRRRELITPTMDNEEAQRREMNRCRYGHNGLTGIEYWFQNYAWIVDPRNSILFAFPFELYDCQKEALEWITSLIFTERSDGLIDKSRDMGVTWLVVCIFTYYWLFPTEGTQFHALITSYRADEVDKTGVPGTVFEKIRQQIRLLPSWMLPKGFSYDEHCTYMRVINSENGSTIVGTTANAETGRSGRYTVIFFDEMASIQQDVSSATAATQSTYTRLFVSTPKGKLNYFAQLRFKGDIPVLSLHWSTHPLKDNRWYEGQKLKMSPEMVAQELDIDYEASQPGLVYQYDEVYHVITKSDFMREVVGGSTVDQWTKKTRFCTPKEWWLGRDHDWGSSDSNGEHANMTYWFMRAKEGTRTKTHNINIGGAVFIYRELMMPPHSTVRAVANRVHELQAPDNEQSRMQVELMSHEALSERDTYEQEHQLYYKAWNTDLNAGIAQAKDYLEIQWRTEPHPFRKVEEGKPIVKGRPMLYLIVDDDQGECYFDENRQRWTVRPGRDENGLNRLRSEITVYHYPVSEIGKPVKKQRPAKLFDDAMDCLRCMAATFPPMAQYSIPERIELALPPSYRAENVLKETPEAMAQLWVAKQAYLRENRVEETVINADRPRTYRTALMEEARRRAAQGKGRK